MSRRKRVKDAGCDAVGERFGKTIKRLRSAGDMSLGDLSEQSGVAKSMISQIEKNESNPTLATITRLSRALGTSVEQILSADPPQTADSLYTDKKTDPLVQFARSEDIPKLVSEDGLCSLEIIGWIDTVEFAQWYDFKAKPFGKLESDAHPAGSVENLSVLAGALKVTVDGHSWIAEAGQTLRYRADREHVIENIGDNEAHATMVNILAFNVI